MQSAVQQLRQLWQNARADASPDLDPDEVFDALELKYQAMIAQKEEPPLNVFQSEAKDPSEPQTP